MNRSPDPDVDLSSFPDGDRALEARPDLQISLLELPVLGCLGNAGKTLQPGQEMWPSEVFRSQKDQLLFSEGPKEGFNQVVNGSTTNDVDFIPSSQTSKV